MITRAFRILYPSAPVVPASTVEQQDTATATASTTVAVSELPEQIAANITLDDQTGCWLWCGYRNEKGYGRISRGWKRSGVYAHRLIYMILVGEIDPGMVLHHRCYNRACVNPDHLEQVTPRDNTLDECSSAPAKVNADKTHCIHGHAFTAENTRIDSDGWRVCRQCRRDRATGDGHRDVPANSEHARLSAGTAELWFALVARLTP